MKENYFLYILILLLLIFNSLTVFLLFSKKDTSDQIQEPTTFVNAAVLDFPREDLIVNLRPLREELLNYFATIEDYDYSLYLESLNSGANVSINPDLRIYPASLSKVPVVMISLKKVELGEWSLSKEFVVEENDISTTWGSLYKEGADNRITLLELINLSLKESDNTAHNVLYHNLSPNDVSDFAESLGLYELFDEKGNITAREYSKIFRALYLASYLDIEHSELVLELLSDTKYNQYLGSALPGDIKFSHKFGEKTLSGLYADSGIMYFENKPILITMLIQRKDLDQQDLANEPANIFQNVSKSIRNYFY